MAQAETLVVKGYRDFVRATDRAGREAKRFTRGVLAGAGEIVRADWARDFSRIDERSAAGLRVSVRQQGVFVQQSLRKTTGLHPEYGRLQMRFGLAALRRKQGDIERAAERAIDQIADHFETG